MKWSELPKEYQDLEKGFDKMAYRVLPMYNDDDISIRIIWDNTIQGFDFWEQCHLAKTISELPKIPLTIKENK